MAQRESKAKPSELVDVRGKLKAVDGQRWARELRALHRKYATGRSCLSVEQILSEDRADRL